jgi:hypothetical protein
MKHVSRTPGNSICQGVPQGQFPSAPTWYDLFVPTEHIVALLIAERDKLNQAIEVLQGPTKRRGRPPKNALNGGRPSIVPEPSQPAQKKRRKFTPAQRKQQAEKMRAYWLAKKKAEAKPQSKAASKAKKAVKVE